MKKTMIFATVFALLHHAVGLGVYYILQQDIMLPTTVINILYMAGWGILSFWLYQKNLPMQQHLIAMSVPIIVMFGLFIPIANALQIPLIVLYFAPAFAFATSIVYMLFSYGTWKVIVISIVLMIFAAWIGALMKQKEPNEM